VCKQRLPQPYLVRMQRSDRAIAFNRDLVGILRRQRFDGLDHVGDAAHYLQWKPLPRRTCLHLSYSCASPFGPAILVTQDPIWTFRALICRAAQLACCCARLRLSAQGGKIIR
jgi:hypothetical protein